MPKKKKKETSPPCAETLLVVYLELWSCLCVLLFMHMMYARACDHASVEQLMGQVRAAPNSGYKD